MYANRRNFGVITEIWVAEHDDDVRLLDRKWKYGRFAHVQWKICNIIYGQIGEIFAFSRLIGNRGGGTLQWRQI